MGKSVKQMLFEIVQVTVTIFFNFDEIWKMLWLKNLDFYQFYQ